jgi:hypothetical protein
MTNHEHNRDLIMALAEGSLDPAAALEAHEVIASCDDCAVELELQRIALASLTDAPPVAMNELEAARFRRNIDTALGHERAVIAAPATSRRRFNWAPVFSVAAILLALVLIAPALQLLGGGGDDAGVDAVSLQEIEDEASSDDAGGALSDAAPQERLTTGTDDAFSAAEAPTSTVAADGDLTESVAGDTAEDLAVPVDDQLLELREALDENDAAATIRITALGYGIALSPPENDRCVVEGASLLDVDASRSYLLGEISGTDGLRLVTVHRDGDELVLLAHEFDTCAVVGRAP